VGPCDQGFKLVHVIEVAVSVAERGSEMGVERRLNMYMEDGVEKIKKYTDTELY
jgi:hypothetical protein